MSEQTSPFLQKAGAFSATAFLTSLPNLPGAEIYIKRWKMRKTLVLPTWQPTKTSGIISSNLLLFHHLINLNNGGVSPAPKTVQDAMKRYYDLSNEAPSYYMWRILDQGSEPLRKNLAKLAGVTGRNCHQP